MACLQQLQPMSPTKHAAAAGVRSNLGGKARVVRAARPTATFDGGPFFAELRAPNKLESKTALWLPV
jgi:hypothetical protein